MFTKEQIKEIEHWLIENTTDGVYYSQLFTEAYGTGEQFEMWPTFDDFWNLYDKKIGDKDKLAKKWLKIPQKIKLDIMEYVPKYKQSQPDKKYRKNPETFLNNKSWNDEIIAKKDTWFENTLQQFKL